MNSNDGLEFGVELEHHVGEVVLAVRGDLDAATAATFWAALEMFDGEGGDLVIDLSAVPFMDSSGVDVIAGTLLRLKGSGGSLCIRNPRRQTRQVLKITGLASYVTIHETESCAANTS